MSVRLESVTVVFNTNCIELSVGRIGICAIIVEAALSTGQIDTLFERQDKDASCGVLPPEDR
jgi:hypothetical protein